MRGIPLGCISRKMCPAICLLNSKNTPVNFLINLITDLSQMGLDVRIGKTQYFQAALFQIGSTLGILLHTFRTVMLRTIQFQHQFRSGAIKIYDIWRKDKLTAKLHRMTA